MDLARFTKLRSFMGSTRTAYELKVSLNTVALCEDGARCGYLRCNNRWQGIRGGKNRGTFCNRVARTRKVRTSGASDDRSLAIMFLHLCMQIGVNNAAQPRIIAR